MKKINPNKAYTLLLEQVRDTTTMRERERERERERDHRNQIKSIDTIKDSSAKMKYL